MNVGKVALNNGTSIPIIGLGTWRSSAEVVTQAVKDALDVGYRHIDCAHIYANEIQIGLAIKEKLQEGAFKREDLYVTSKLWNTFHNPKMVRSACETSLKNLQLYYLDNYLIHWPTAFKDGEELYPKDESDKILFAEHDYVDTWKAMEQLVDAGLCRTIGISNFNKRQIERLLKQARIKPAILQIECHPYLNQKALIDYCRAVNIAVTAYSPLGSAHSPYAKPGEFQLLENPKILQIAAKYERNAAEVLLRYQTQRGLIVIPRSVNRSHMLTNLKVDNFDLSTEDMTILDSLDINGRFMTFTAAAGHPHHPFENDAY